MDNDKQDIDAPTVGSREPAMPKASSSFAGREEKVDGKPRSGLPVVEPFHSSASSFSSNDRTGVFAQLVKADDDIAGLVAYSIYKQNKLDWLTAFEAEKGRVPNADELAAYIVGEGTPRRIATYRHLAEATLAGHGPAVSDATFAGHGPRPAIRRVGGGLAGRTGTTPGTLAIYAAVAVLFLVAFMLAWHYTASSR